MSTAAVSPTNFGLPPSEPGAPSWPVALLYPLQGQWSEEEYLTLQNRTTLLVELSDGQIEVLPMPNPLHQRIARYLFKFCRHASPQLVRARCSSRRCLSDCGRANTAIRMSSILSPAEFPFRSISRKAPT